MWKADKLLPLLFHKMKKPPGLEFAAALVYSRGRNLSWIYMVPTVCNVSETTFSPRRNALAVALLVLKRGEEGFMTTFCRNSMRRFVLAVLFVSMCGALAFAQSTTEGAIGGTVYDTSGAVVGGARIVIHNNGTNAEQSIKSDASGYYRVTGLQPGSYTVTITRDGFAPYKAEQVIVQVGSVTEISPKLAPAGSVETIDVTAEAPQINFTSPEFAPTFNQTAISNLPICRHGLRLYFRQTRCR